MKLPLGVGPEPQRRPKCVKVFARGCLGVVVALEMAARACLGHTGAFKFAARAFLGAAGAFEVAAPGLPRNRKGVRNGCSRLRARQYSLSSILLMMWEGGWEMGVTHYIVRHYDLEFLTPPHPTPPPTTPPHPTHLYSILIYTLTYPKNPFANTRFIMPRSVSAAQAQHLGHFGLRTSSNHYPTPDHFSCTGAVFRAFEMFLFIVHFLCAGLFLMHRRSTSCILCCQRDPTLIQPQLFCMRRRSASECFCCTGAVLRAFGLHTLFRPPTTFHAQAQCFVHLGCFCQLCISRALVLFDA